MDLLQSSIQMCIFPANYQVKSIKMFSWSWEKKKKKILIKQQLHSES